MAKEGEVTYELRGDDSNLEADLSKAEKKIEEHAQKTAEATVKTEKKTTEAVKKEQKEAAAHHKQQKGKQEEVEKQSAKTFKGLAKEISADAKAQASGIKATATKSLNAIKHPIKSISSFAGDKSKDIRQHFKDSFHKTKEHAISGMEKVSHAILHPVETAKTAASSIQESFSKAMGKVGSVAAVIGKAGAKAVGSGLLAAGGAVVTAGTMAVKGAVDMDKAMNGFLASTGKGAEEADKYQKVLEGIYKNNYGEDFGDIADAMGQVTKQLGDMPDADLQNITESAFALRDTFEYDIQESTRAAKAMIDNFGVSGEKAMGLLAAGAQNGLDYSGELIDSISEYSVQFAKVGLDADDMFKIFEKGAETGAWNLDKIGDAVKEMSIRVIDGSDTTAAGFEALGLNADDMAGKFAAGGDSAKEAFQQTIDALAKMEDPLAQNAAGVALFGTMWEDLGPDVVTQLASIQDGAYDTADAMQGIKDVKYDDLGSMFEGLTRSVELLLLPLGEQLIPLLSQLIEAMMPIIEEVLPPLTEAFGEVIAQIAPMIEELLPLLLETISQLLPPLMEIIGMVLPVLGELMATLLPPLMEIIGAVLPVLLELINALLPIFSTLASLLQPIINLFMQLLQPVLNLISQALVPLVNAIAPLISMIISALIPVLNFLASVFSTVFGGIFSSVSDVMGNITNIFKGIVDFVKNVFSGNWKGAWESIKSIFSNIVSGFGNIFKVPINFIIDLINGFIGGLNKIQIPDWVPGVGGFGLNIPTIPRLRVGMDYVPSDDFPAFLHKGEAVLTAQENALYQANGGLSGVVRNLEHPVNNRENSIDYERLAKAVAAHAPEVKVIMQKGAIEGAVTIDGRKAGSVLAPVIDKELGVIQKEKERG